MGMNVIMRKGIFLSALFFFAFYLFKAGIGKGVAVNEPIIVNNEPVVYLDNTDQISVQGEGVQSITYSSSDKKVAKISQKGKITPKKKGTTTIQAKVAYQAGGQSREAILSYSLKVLGKSKEYFIYLDHDPSIVGLTEAGKKLRDVYIPERYRGKKVTSIFTDAFTDGSHMERLYLSDYVEDTTDYTEGWVYPELSARMDKGCNQLREIHLGKNVEGFWISDKLPKLEKITVDSGNKTYYVQDGILFKKDGTLALYPAGRKDASYAIPKGIAKIRDSAFAWAKNLKHVSIPAEIDTLNETFRHSGLKEVTLPEGLTYCSSAFQGCTDLEKVVVPTLPNIKLMSYAFRDCPRLKTVQMENLPDCFDGGNFMGCSSLESIQLSRNTRGLVQKDGVVFDSSMETLLLYPAGKRDKHYRLPDDVKKIHDLAFAGVQHLSEVTLNRELRDIGEQAFYEANIDKVHFNNCLRNIGDYSFYMCSMTEAILSDSVLTIGYGAFEECKRLRSVRLSSNIEELHSIFLGCSSLRTLHIPKKVKKIVSGAGLRGSRYGDAIGTKTGCSSLASITVEKGSKYYTAVKGVLFNKSKTTLIVYPAAKKDKKYSVPKSVKKISNWAFAGCDNIRELAMEDRVAECGDSSGEVFFDMGSLRKIRLSKKLRILGPSMFTDCRKLQKIRIPDKVKTIHEYTFDGCTSLKSIVLGKRTRRIQACAFQDCRNLRKMIFREKRWNAVLLERRACFARAGSSNYGRLVVHVPKTWKKKKLVLEAFRDAGLSKKAKIKYY